MTMKAERIPFSGLICIVILALMVSFARADVLEVSVGPVRSKAKRADGALVSIATAEKTEGHTKYDIVYMSDGLRITGKLFVPAGAEGGDGRLPAVVFNHGDVSGVGWTTEVRCAELAEDGYVVLAPSYRGEGGSEGEVEVAAGEVSDALNAAAVLRGLPYVDPARVGMAGTSHGALITILATTRTDILRAAVAAYGVTNAVSWYKYLVENGFDVTDDLSRKVYGDGPEDRPEAFRVRSPVLFAEKINTPLLLLYGEKDKIIPPSQGRELEAKLKEHKKDFAFEIVPAVGHGFLFYLNAEKHTDEEMKNAAAAWDRVKDFLGKHLKAGDVEHR
ncbi:MAG: alpha/beta fold hydrolase [bacterium]